MKKYNIANDLTVSLGNIPNLEYRAMVISNEGISDILNNIPSMFTSRIEAISNIFTTAFIKLGSKDIEDLTLQSSNLFKLNPDVIKIINNVEYGNVKDLKIPGIIGLKVDLLNLTSSIKPVIESININLISMLDQTDTVVSRMISDPDYRKSFSPKNTYTNYLKSLDISDDFIKSVIDSNVRTDITTIGAMLPNISSLSTVFDNLQYNNKSFNNKLFKEMRDKTVKLADKTNVLYKLFTSQDIDSLTRESLLELAAVLEYTAQYVTISTSVFYLLNQTNDVTSAMIKILKEKGMK